MTETTNATIEIDQWLEPGAMIPIDADAITKLVCEVERLRRILELREKGATQ